MEKHLAEKAVFESLPERTSLAALREGQRLKRNEEQICNHFAQLAEFATGIPAHKFEFRLDLKSAYETDLEGNIVFGPSALTDDPPFVHFNVQNIFGTPAPEPKEEEPEAEIVEEPKEAPEPPEKPLPDFSPLSLTFSSEISQKYDRPFFSALDEKRMTVTRPVKTENRVDHFIEKVSAVDNYVNGIIDKYTPEPSEASAFEGFFIYEGDFVYLSRKGKWATVRTTVLAQKDYFKDAPVSAPLTKRKLPVVEPFSEIEVGDAAELITDDMAEPVASVKSDLGLGYFLPVRRVGRTLTPVQDIKTPAARGRTELPALPVVGSQEFAEDVAQKAESSGHPIEEIGPAYISTSGKKIRKAKSFTHALQSRMQLPKSEPARNAVEALLPKMQEIIRKSEKDETQEEAVLALERDFDTLVEAHLEPFRIAARSTAPSRVSPVLRKGRVETALESPTQDALGVFARYQPEAVRRESPAAVMLRRLGGLASRMIPSIAETITPSAMTEVSQAVEAAAPTQRPVQGSPAETARSLPSLLRRMASALPIDRVTEAVSGVMRDLPGRLPTERLSSFAGDIMNRFSEGIPGQIGERFGHLFQPSRLTELTRALTPGRVGNLLQRGAPSDLPGPITSPSGIGGLASNLLGQVQPSGLLQNLFGSRQRAGGPAAGAEVEIAQRGGLFGRLLEAPTSLMRRETGGVLGQLVSTARGAAESAGGGGITSLLSRGSGLLGGLAGDASQMAESITSRGPSGLSGIASALGMGGGEPASGAAAGERAQRPGFGAGLDSLVGEGAGMPEMGGGLQRATGAVGGLVSRGLSGLSSMASGLLGIGGAASRASGFAQGVTERASGFLGGAASSAGGFLQRAASGATGAIGSLASGGLGQAAQRAEGLMGGIGGLVSRGAGAVQEGASSLLGRVGAMGASLPSMGGARSMAEGALGRAGEMLPESMPDISSAMGSGSLPFDLPQLQRGMPRGWDRPPFEVGDAIQRHIGEGAPQETEGEPQRAVSRLRDYGLSLIDLEDETAEQVSSPLEALQDEEELDLDDDTIESIYFRLKRILETEEERMGGEA